MSGRNAPRLWLRVLTPDGGRVGPGMVALLKSVDAEGSIAAGARAQAMSYRRAWMLLDSARAALGSAVVETSIGGKDKGGASLTETGRALIALYDRLDEKANAAVAEELDAFFAGLPKDAS